MPAGACGTAGAAGAATVSAMTGATPSGAGAAAGSAGAGAVASVAGGEAGAGTPPGGVAGDVGAGLGLFAVPAGAAGDVAGGVGAAGDVAGGVGAAGDVAGGFGTAGDAAGGVGAAGALAGGVVFGAAGSAETAETARCPLATKSTDAIHHRERCSRDTLILRSRGKRVRECDAGCCLGRTYECVLPTAALLRDRPATDSAAAVRRHTYEFQCIGQFCCQSGDSFTAEPWCSTQQVRSPLWSTRVVPSDSPWGLQL
jgi:hypothetical protein